MCAIIDKDVLFEAFGRKQTEAGIQFRGWLDSGRGTLVVGGQNLKELTQNKNFERWFMEERRREDRVRQIKDEIISKREQALGRDGRLRSNDKHVLALALVSGARLLYSNDCILKIGFLNAEVIQKPRGKVYTTRRGKKYSKDFTDEHKHLLQTKNLCRAPVHG